MDHALLARTNLNLLLTLDALLEERSVTRAAARLGVTQSAVSHALRQLREQLGDRLFVRARGAMAPTPRALALAGPLRQGLRALQQAMEDAPEFDPARSRRRFVLATTDLVAATVSPALVARLREEAPGVELEIVPAESTGLGEALEVGEVDAALVPAYEGLGALERRKLFDETFSCLVREGHPGVGRRLSLKRYCALDHALIRPTGEGQSVVDPLLEERGLSRRVTYRVRYFAAAPFVIARSDLILTAPTRLCRLFAEALPLRVLKPPLPLPPFAIYAYWHPRWRADPGHRWLRAQLASAHFTR